MLRKKLAVLGAASMIFCLSSCAMTEIPTREVPHHTDIPPKMLFLGDSIAAGYGLDGYAPNDLYSCRSYSNILKDRYEAELRNECGHVMVNKSVSGYTSDDLIKQVMSGDLDSDLKDSDAVVISIGGNDLLGIMLGLLGELGMTDSGSFDSQGLDIFGAASSFLSMDSDVNKALEKFDENIKTISAELNKRTDGTIYIQTLYDPLEYFDKFKMLAEFSDEKIGKLNSIISGNSSSGYTVIDVAADFRGKSGTLTNIGNFDIHPNAEGHEVIAEDVDKAFRATGFTYLTTEQGEKQLTEQGRKAVGGGVAAIAGLFGISTIAMITKKKKY